MNTLDKLIILLSRLPGIGKKSAMRMAYALLKGDDEYNKLLGQAVLELKDKIKPCSSCGNYTEQETCSICCSSERNSDMLCVVEESRDVIMIESTGDYKGLYFVLHGVLSPLDGIGPKELGFDRLLHRIEALEVKELILATNPTLEGDSTALYLKHILEKKNIHISRIATGLPVGGDMEYADSLSISRAFKGRMKF